MTVETVIAVAVFALVFLGVFGENAGCALITFCVMACVIYLVLAYFLIFCIVVFILMLLGAIVALASP